MESINTLCPGLVWFWLRKFQIQDIFYGKKVDISPANYLRAPRIDGAGDRVKSTERALGLLAI